MAVIITTLAPDNSTDAAFRAWGKAISDALTSFGIIKTADTGQIDWSTVIKPAQGASAGYEIRRFTDTLQNTHPLFFKLEFGAYSSTLLGPALWITLGTGSNGSGTLTGNLTNRFPIASNSSSATLFNCLFSGSNNRFTLLLFINSTYGSFITLERTKDPSGEDNSIGAQLSFIGVVNPGGTQTRLNQFYPFIGTIPAPQDLGILQPLGVASGLDGADVNYYPNFLFRNGTPLNPGITHFAYFHPDVVANNQAIVSVYGVNRNYYFCGNVAPFNNFSRGGLTTMSLAVLAE